MKSMEIKKDIKFSQPIAGVLSILGVIYFLPLALLSVASTICFLPLFLLLYAVQSIRNPDLAGTKIYPNGKKREKYIELVIKQVHYYFAIVYKGDIGVVIHVNNCSKTGRTYELIQKQQEERK